MCTYAIRLSSILRLLRYILSFELNVSTIVTKNVFPFGPFPSGIPIYTYEYVDGPTSRLVNPRREKAAEKRQTSRCSVRKSPTSSV